MMVWVLCLWLFPLSVYRAAQFGFHPGSENETFSISPHQKTSFSYPQKDLIETPSLSEHHHQPSQHSTALAELQSGAMNSMPRRVASLSIESIFNPIRTDFPSFLPSPSVCVRASYANRLKSSLLVFTVKQGTRALVLFLRFS